MNSMKYNLVMYQEIEIINFLEILLKSKGKNISAVKYAYILHDKDFNDNTGELKKIHYHLYLEFPSQVKSRDIENCLILANLPISYLSYERTNSNFLAYMTHQTRESKENKISYPFENIISNILNLRERYEEALEKANKLTPQEKKLLETKEIISNIMTIINQNYHITNLGSLTMFLMENDMTKELKYCFDKAYALKEILRNTFERNSKEWASKELNNKKWKEIEL